MLVTLKGERVNMVLLNTGSIVLPLFVTTFIYKCYLEIKTNLNKITDPLLKITSKILSLANITSLLPLFCHCHTTL